MTETKLDIPEAKPRTTYGKFNNIDMRVAIIREARLVTDVNFPMRFLDLDLGPLGERRSLGKFALLDEDRLVEAHVIVCVNLSPKEVGPYTSDALVLGTRHPDSPPDQDQAVPLWAHEDSQAGEPVF
jgi:tRNA-binding protein